MVQVQRIEIIGTDFVTYEAWTPVEGYGSHSFVTHLDGVIHGRLGAEALPADLDALEPGSSGRLYQVTTWQEANYQRAYDAIIEAAPAAADGTRSMGTISTREGA